jgi:mitogen-activated protein kinase kinase
MSDPFKARTLKRKNVKGLALNAPPRAANPSEGDSQIPGALGNSESDRTDTLEIGLEFKLDLRSEDLIVLKELGAGNGGTVSKVMHASTKVVMARKVSTKTSLAKSKVFNTKWAIDHSGRCKGKRPQADCQRTPGWT